MVDPHLLKLKMAMSSILAYRLITHASPSSDWATFHERGVTRLLDLAIAHKSSLDLSAWSL